MNLAEAFSLIVTPDRNVGFRAYDGSSAGPQDGDAILEVRNRRAVEYLAGAPSQLGLARAYVNGALEIVGDPYIALSRLYPMKLTHLTTSDKIALGKKFAPYVMKRPAPPPQERKLGGSRHSKKRDAEAIHQIGLGGHQRAGGPAAPGKAVLEPGLDAGIGGGRHGADPTCVDLSRQVECFRYAEPGAQP